MRAASYLHRTRVSFFYVYENWKAKLGGGRPFPMPMCEQPRPIGDPPVPNEIPIAVATRAYGATWQREDTPMLLHMFEYIAGGALLEWWQSMVPANEPSVT